MAESQRGVGKYDHGRKFSSLSAGEAVAARKVSGPRLVIKGEGIRRLEGVLRRRSIKRHGSPKITTHYLPNRLKVEIPRIMRGESQEIETLINEEALLFAKYARGEKTSWQPRIVDLNL